MKKYSGSVSIFDNEGNSIFEKELTYDEIIDHLLSKPVTDTVDPVPEPPPRKTYTRKAPDPSGESVKGKRFSGHACCGSRGARHLNSCTNGSGAPAEGDTKTDRVRNAILNADREGTVTDEAIDDIAEECDTSARIVKFMVVQMRQRGSIK